MVLSNEQVKKFQTLYHKHFGEEINEKEAYEQGIKLLTLLSLIYNPMTEEEFKKSNREEQ